MAHQRGKGGKTWRKGKVDMNALPEVLNVRCCCTPKNILGTIADNFAKKYKIKRFGNEVAVYGDGNPLSFWLKQEGFFVQP